MQLLVPWSIMFSRRCCQAVLERQLLLLHCPLHCRRDDFGLSLKSKQVTSTVMIPAYSNLWTCASYSWLWKLCGRRYHWDPALLPWHPLLVIQQPLCPWLFALCVSPEYPVFLMPSQQWLAHGWRSKREAVNGFWVNWGSKVLIIHWSLRDQCTPERFGSQLVCTKAIRVWIAFLMFFFVNLGRCSVARVKSTSCSKFLSISDPVARCQKDSLPWPAWQVYSWWLLVPRWKVGPGTVHLCEVYPVWFVSPSVESFKCRFCWGAVMGSHFATFLGMVSEDLSGFSHCWRNCLWLWYWR